MKNLSKTVFTTLILLSASLSTYASRGGDGISNSYKKTWNRTNIIKKFNRDAAKITSWNEALPKRKLTVAERDLLLGSLSSNYELDLLACTGVQVQNTFRGLNKRERDQRYNKLSEKAANNCIKVYEESLEKYENNGGSEAVINIVIDSIESFEQSRD